MHQKRSSPRLISLQWGDNGGVPSLNFLIRSKNEKKKLETVQM
jgi:hypothetical protein